MHERPPLLTDLFRMVVKMIVGGIVIIGLVSCGVGVVAGAGANANNGRSTPLTPKETPHLYGEEKSENVILRIDIRGPIAGHPPTDLPSGPFAQIIPVTFGYQVKEQLLAAATNDEVKAIMLFVSTPGGSVVGSEAILDGVKAVKEAGKPIVAYVDTISASGGVYATASADKIFADHGSVIGSVGVILGNILYYDDPIALDGGLFGGGVTTRGGIKSTIISASIGKDLGNPFRPITEREQRELEASVRVLYDQFLDRVVEGRGMDRTALVEDYGAMIYANELAERYGYIDGTKTYQETLGYIAGEIGAEGDDWRLIGPERARRSPFFGLSSQLFGSDPAATSAARDLLQSQICAELGRGPLMMSARALSSHCGV